MAAPRALRKREEAGRGWWRVSLQQLHLRPGAVLGKAGSFPSGFWPLGLSHSASVGGHSENPTFGSEVCRQAISLETCLLSSVWSDHGPCRVWDPAHTTTVEGER